MDMIAVILAVRVREGCETIGVSERKARKQWNGPSLLCVVCRLDVARSTDMGLDSTIEVYGRKRGRISDLLFDLVRTSFPFGDRSTLRQRGVAKS